MYSSRWPAASFAYNAAKRTQFEARGAAGESHLLYANSPGGVVATARRVAAFNAPIQSAAAAAHVDPRLLEAIVFLESGGRPDVVAGTDPSAAAGVAVLIVLFPEGLFVAGVFIPVAALQAASVSITLGAAVATVEALLGC